MVIGFYFLTFLLALAMTGINIFRSKKADTRFLLMGIAVTLNCLGRFLLSVSHTVELAVWANKMLYLGACFIAPIIIIVMVQFCGFQMNNGVKYAIFTYAAVIYGFVLTIGHSDIYYKSVELQYKDGYYYLVKEYGPAHALYTVFMLMCVALLSYYMIMAIRKRNVISLRIVFVATTFGIAIIVCYMLERWLNSTIEWLSVGYLLAAMLMTYLFNRFNMYDMSINISHYVDRMQEYGYIVFDKKLRYVNSNEYAKTLFSEITKWHVDEVVKKEESLVYREIVENLPSWKTLKDEKTLRVGDAYVEMSIQDISYGRRNKTVGYIIEITDKTVEHKYLKAVEAYNDDLEQEVAKKTADVLYMKDMMMLGMATMVESRDNSTGGHIRRTSDVVKVFARQLLLTNKDFGVSEDFLNMVIKAAPMHDLGKIAVDDKILRKQGKFTDEEYAEMKKHSAEGAKIVEKILGGVEDEEFVKLAQNVAHYHHEKWNGKGYPCGIAGAEIPLEARIMALADVFDALVSKRCYKDAFSYDKAFSIIEEDLGTHFDPELGKVFLKCRTDLEEMYNDYDND